MYVTPKSEYVFSYADSRNISMLDDFHPKARSSTHIMAKKTSMMLNE